MNYNIPARPMAPDIETQERWEHTAMRRRMLTGIWEQDLEHELSRHLPMDRRDSWGPPDMSSNVISNVCRQLAMLYHEEPTVTHPDFDVAPLVGRNGYLIKAGLFPLMQRVQQYAIGRREAIVRIDVTSAGLQFRLISPDVVYAIADENAPDVPVYYQEMNLRYDKETEEMIWVAECISIKPGKEPYYGLHLINEDGSKGKDVTERFMGHPALYGDAYPYRAKDGTAFLPLEIYRAEKTGRLFNPYDASQLAYGSLTAGVLWSFFTHCVRDASWPQRYTAGLVVQGLEIENTNINARRATVTTDPSSILMFSPDLDSNSQPLIGQFQAGCDPIKLLEAISKYEIRVSTAAGISGDILRQSGDPRSGYAISVSRSGQREISRKFAPVQRITDESLINKAAILCNKYLGANLPEDHRYRIQYKQISLSPEEMKAQREDVIQKLNANLISPVDAIQILNPDLDRDGAIAELNRIRRERTEFI